MLLSSLLSSHFQAHHVPPCFSMLLSKKPSLQVSYGINKQSRETNFDRIFQRIKYTSIRAAFPAHWISRSDIVIRRFDGFVILQVA